MTAADPPMSAVPIACTLSDERQAARQRELQWSLRPAIREVVELDDGYRLRFPPDPDWIRALADLIAFERACCPFLSFELAAEADRGALWLKIGGPDGTKEFLGMAFGLCGVEPSP